MQAPIYGEAFRKRMVERMSGPSPVTARALSAEVGVCQPTLSRWLREASSLAKMPRKKPPRDDRTRRRRSEPTGAEKVRIVLEAAALPESELGAFLRREGLHEQDLARLREEVQAAAVAGFAASKPRGETEEHRRIKELERNLRRKDAALAETAALLVLRKKAVALWGEEGDDT
jgi:hypothetical protein